MKYKIIYVTAKDEEEAKKIGKALVSEKLVACVNFFPIGSVFRWKGKVEEEKEAGMFLKTKESLVDLVVKRVKELHSYKVPCVLVLDVSGGNKEFLDWVGKETR